MELQGFILSALIGAMIGWLAGFLIQGKGFGTLWNIVIGLLGGFTGGCLFYVITLIQYKLLYHLIFGVLGALGIMWVVILIKRGYRK